MKPIFRKSLIAGALAVFAASPVWAAGDKAEKSTTTGAEPSATTRSPTTAGAQIQNMTPRELEGKDVVGQNGKEIGSVKEVVRSREQGNIQVVISAGGVMGMGDKEIAVPLDQLSLRDDKLHISATEEDLKTRTEYKSEQFVELEPTDRPISEFSAFEPTPGEATPRRGTTGTTDMQRGDRTTDPAPNRLGEDPSDRSGQETR